ncbi:hypothetical protein [Hymenobacter psychrotolerans]|uniref:Uncharacterized protein n=1 Tax=Hymenobacter psychrotolerans DSM 18569 TaxID=1121959 RepID=A0A1M7FV64_9BACT|nr:hypothetical protein [Hymenobacter psychrotolerans]SHM07805.1 hypothetical protein SAMN02746009_03901 [Hymenobacter psychrotolerans DSM 18569]
MKHIFRVFFLVCLFASAAWAQQAPAAGKPGPLEPPVDITCAEPVGRPQAVADSLLELLDKSQIPTGLLYDRVFPTGQPGIH